MDDFELIIESDINNLYLIERFIDEISDYYNILNNYHSNISISVIEAVKNAILHGGDNSNNDKVSIQIKEVLQGVEFIITDTGSGFDYNSLENPIESNSQETQNGVFLMQHLSDNCTFNNVGNTVSLFFNFSSIDNNVTISRHKLMNNYLSNNTVAKDVIHNVDHE